MNKFLQAFFINEDDFLILTDMYKLPYTSSFQLFNDVLKQTYTKERVFCYGPSFFEGEWIKEQCKLEHYTKNILFTRKHIKNKKLINNNNNNYHYKNKHKKIGWMNNGKY